MLSGAPAATATLESIRRSQPEQPDQVDLSRQNLSGSGLPDRLWSFDSLRSLNLSGNQLADLPGRITQLSALTGLDLSSNALTSVPGSLFQLTTLTDLNVGRNQITAVSSQLSSLVQLKYLNLMNNSLTALPTEIGNLKQLYRLGLKSNKLTSLPDSIGGLEGLVELFITDNCLQSLPDGMAGLQSLVKLQASFNQLKSLPAAMSHLPRLELMRVAVNNISEVPPEFSQLPALAWFSLAGNPACQSAPPIRRDILPLTMDQLELNDALGDGASGDVIAAKFQGRPVAVKVFKAETSPDGHARDEIAVTCHVNHPNLIKVIGIIDHPHALVLERVWGAPLALKPNFQSLLRCRWEQGKTYTKQFVVRVAFGVANALAYLHEHSICHGDVYGHNVLTDGDGHSVLCDYGASFFYQPGSVCYQQQEVRAYGLLIQDLASRLSAQHEESHSFEPLQQQKMLEHIVRVTVMQVAAAERPNFKQIVELLHNCNLDGPR